MLTKWNPLREMEELHSEMDRLFSRFLGNGASSTALGPGWPQLTSAHNPWPGHGPWQSLPSGRNLNGNWSMPLDITEEEEGITLRVALPGIAPEDIHVEVEDNILTLRAERQFENSRESSGRHWVEQNYGSFSRSLTLPRYADADKIAARYEHGVLQLTIPKKESALPRRIPLQLGQGEVPEMGKGDGATEAPPALVSGSQNSSDGGHETGAGTSQSPLGTAPTATQKKAA